jgi:hypothetical protein
MVVKFRNTICPLPPQLSLHIGGLCCQAIQTEHGAYIAERTRNAVYILIYLWERYIHSFRMKKKNKKEDEEDSNKMRWKGIEV